MCGKGLSEIISWSTREFGSLSAPTYINTLTFAKPSVVKEETKTNQPVFSYTLRSPRLHIAAGISYSLGGLGGGGAIAAVCRPLSTMMTIKTATSSNHTMSESPRTITRPTPWHRTQGTGRGDRHVRSSLVTRGVTTQGGGRTSTILISKELETPFLAVAEAGCTVQEAPHGTMERLQQGAALLAWTPASLSSRRERGGRETGEEVRTVKTCASL